ncbi:hypothetical protein L3X38_037846 [Prunus dulcis]|uniref:Multidrug resistance-associated protein 9 n=1 Tax=Prunus dulcis TaxID=3755 RepID=A0AAD4V4H8_PRUDU|nr:hypothetical protein L3X38_037846 [Prunus dulcis]
MAGSGSSEARIPMFSGENYEFWRIKMVTIFKSYGLWGLVEKGVLIPDSQTKKESEDGSEEEIDEKTAAILMKDAKALGIIQNAVSDQIFPRIANADSAKMAWNLLYSEYHGGEHVRSVKLQNLRREFEYTRMRDSETLSEYLTRLTELINQMKTFGEVLSKERQVQKVLISLSKKYDPICIVIENTKTLETVDLQEVIAILKSQEQRLEMHSVDTAEKAFASFTVNAKGQNKNTSQSGSSKSQKSWNSKGKSWEAKDKSQQNNYSAQNHTSTQFSNQENTKPQCKVCSKHHFGECRYKGKPKCYNCDRFGHLARDCTVSKNVQKANCVNQMEVTGNLFYANCSTTEIKANEWYIDSGCRNHMTGNLELLADVRTNVAGRVQMPTGALVSVAGIGSLSIDTAKGRKYIREVMYLPGLKENLLSVGQMDEHGYCLVFGEGMCRVFDSPSMDYLITKVEMKSNRCYPVSVLAEKQLLMKTSFLQSPWIWHKRLGHLNFGGLKQLRDKEMVHGLPQLEEQSGVCEGCQFGKQHRNVFPKDQAQRASKVLELVHVDLCGPMRNESVARNRYFMLIIDDFTIMIWVYFLRNKSEAFYCFKKFKSMTELQTGHKVQCIRSDRGGEFLSTDFLEFCEANGIQRQLTMAYTPQQNGVVERKNRTVIEMAKSMLHEKGMPYFLWTEAVHTTVYLLNRCPTKALNNITPFEAYSGRKPGIAHLKVFGSLCYVHVPTELRHKLEPKSTKGVFVGYATCEKGYRVFDPVSNKLLLSRDVTFDEENAWHWTDKDGSVMTSYSIEDQVDLDLKSDRSNENSTGTPQTLDMQESTSSTPGDISSEERRTQAYDHTPLKWRRLDDVLAQCNLCIMEPEKYADAAQDESWLKAMEDELQMIEKNETWELVDRPTEKPVIGVKWVYKTKLNLDGSVQKNKPRLVAKGYAQKPGLDYNETYAPVARLDTIRTLIALAAKKGWKLFQLDVKSAFLNGVLQEEVYVNHPEGFVIKGKEDKVYRLHKALYGLKQAPRAWYGEIDSYFTQCGFVKSLSEATLYTKVRGDKEILIVSIYVDDIVYTGSSQALLAEFKEDMMAKYEMTDLGLLHHFLGMGVVQTESSIFLHQKKYASTLLSKFGLTECKSVTTPLVATEKLSKDDGSGAANEEQYRSIVGSLLYLTATRPDIMYASSLLARFMHCPTNRHYGTAKRVLRYIRGTLDYGLEYVKGKSSILIGYCDMKQNCVALSTAEAEYISAAEATTQAIWLRFVLEDFGELQTEATPLHCDNISAIAITKNPVFHRRQSILTGDRFNYLRGMLGVKSPQDLKGSVEL